jgi:outer membrane lipoprotein-sorting protein
MDMTRRFLLLACLAVGLLLRLDPAVAATPKAPAPLSEADKADIARVERYLNEIRTVKSQFVQVNPDGSLMKGIFYLSRPGKMRLEYDPPVKNFIVADGWFVFFWDGELEQQSSQPIGSSLADLILRDNIHLSGEVTVTGIARGSKTLEVTLVKTDDAGSGQLTLIFEDHPMSLRKWRVLDAQGLTTETGLVNPQFGVPLDRNLFYFKAPEKSRN